MFTRQSVCCSMRRHKHSRAKWSHQTALTFPEPSCPMVSLRASSQWIIIQRSHQDHWWGNTRAKSTHGTSREPTWLWSLQLANGIFVGVAGNVCEIDDDVMDDPSQDQQCLLKTCLPMQNDQNDSKSGDLGFPSTASPGAICHARRLTRANPTLRLHIITRSPSPELQKLVSFIVSVYAPTCFQIRTHSRSRDGALNFFLVCTCRELSDDAMQKYVQNVLSRHLLCTSREYLECCCKLLWSRCAR